MTTLPVVMTAAEMYPRSDEAVLDLLRGVETGQTDGKGASLLRRPLTVVEKQMLSRRAVEVAPLLRCDQHRKVVQAVLQMLLGFGGPTVDKEQAAVIATQHATMLRDVPLWAVQQACHRFGNGSVVPDEYGEKTLETRRFPPSSAQLAIVARKAARRIFEEAGRIGMAQRGSVARPESPPKDPSTLLKVRAMHQDFSRGNAEREAERLAAEARRGEESRRTMAAANLRRQLEEYRRLGLEPVYADKGKTMLLSLALLRQQGYTVEDGPGGKSVLIKPPKAEPEHRDRNQGLGS